MEGTPTAIGSFTLTAILTDKRQLVMSGHILLGEDQDTINAKLDAFQGVLDRQVVRMDIISKEAELAAGLNGIEAHKQFYSDMIDRKKATGKLTSTEKERIGKFDLEVRAMVARCDSLRAAIAQGQKKLNGAAPQE